MTSFQQIVAYVETNLVEHPARSFAYTNGVVCGFAEQIYRFSFRDTVEYPEGSAELDAYLSGVQRGHDEWSTLEGAHRRYGTRIKRWSQGHRPARKYLDGIAREAELSAAYVRLLALRDRLPADTDAAS